MITLALTLKCGSWWIYALAEHLLVLFM